MCHMIIRNKAIPITTKNVPTDALLNNAVDAVTQNAIISSFLSNGFAGVLVGKFIHPIFH